MSDVPSNLIPTRITQLPIAPVADENSLMMIVYQGNNYQIRVGDLLSVAGVPVTRQVIAGTGLTGGGQLNNNVTLSIAVGGVGTTELSSTGVTPGTYGDATTIPVFTVDEKGRVTSAGSIPVVVSGYVPVTRQVIAGTGMTGGGALNANVTVNANLSNSTPLPTNGLGAPGVSTAIARIDHQHPSINLQNADEVDGLLPLNRGGTARSLVPNAGAIIWCGADGLYVGPVGTAGKALISGGTGAYTWGDIVVSVNGKAGVVVLDYADVGAPSITGNDATGTWNIDITGSAATATTASTATKATNLAGGAANKLPYQSNTDTTGFINAPTIADTFLKWTGSTFSWSALPGSGTVTSVGLALPSEFTISNSPVTSSGTLTGAWASQTANYFLAAPNGAPGTPSFRAIVSADIPTLNQNTTGQAGSVANSVTFTTSGGAASPATFNGSGAVTIDYSTVGAPKTDGTGASGTWGIGISGNAATATAATNVSGGAANKIVYNTNASTTSFIDAPTISDTFLKWTGSAFAWAVNPLGTVTSVDVSGGTTGLTTSGGPVTSSGTITLAGTLAVANGGTGATDAGTARTNLGAAASGANADITSLTGITGNISTATYIDFATGATVTPAVGRIWWDGGTTLNAGMTTNVTGKIMETLYIYIKASATITKGDVVVQDGTVGASGVLKAKPAPLNTTNAVTIIGIAAESIALNGFGLIQVRGYLTGLNTTGSAVGETWADGDLLYYNPSYVGGLTNVKPTAPSIKLPMCEVVTAGSGGSGSLFIIPGQSSVLGGTDSNVQFGALSNNDVIIYDSVSAYWKNVAQSTLTAGKATNIAGGTTGALPYNSAADTTTFLSLGTTNYVLTAGASAPQYVAQSTLTAGKATNLDGGIASQIPYQTGAGATSFIANGTAGQMLMSNGTSAPSWSDVNGGTF